MSQEPTEKDIEKATEIAEWSHTCCECSDAHTDQEVAERIASALAAEREELETKNKQLEREIIWAERDNRKLEQKLIEWDRFNKSVTENAEATVKAAIEHQRIGFEREIEELKESLRREREKSKYLLTALDAIAISGCDEPCSSQTAREALESYQKDASEK